MMVVRCVGLQATHARFPLPSRRWSLSNERLAMTPDASIRLGDLVVPTLTRHKKVGEPFRLPAVDLLTHMFVCGASGFGKTVLGKGVVEECALAGIPVLVIDLKGDLTSLALDGDGLAAQDTRTQ